MPRFYPGKVVVRSAAAALVLTSALLGGNQRARAEFKYEKIIKKILKEQSAPMPPDQPMEAHGDGLMVKRSAIMKTEPVADLGVARYWVMEKKPDVMCLLAEVSGTVPMHFHPDGVHRMYMLEGKMRCTIGTETMLMEPGDFMMIPRGVRHKLERVGEAKAYFVTVDSPPIDPKNNVWIEPAPGAKARTTGR